MNKKKQTRKDDQTIVADTPVRASDALGQELVVGNDEVPSLGIITPQITPQQAREAWRAYQELCQAILTPNDFVKVNGKDFKKKSAWRKLSTAFNLSTEIVKEERTDYEDYFVVRITARTTAPNGRFMDGTGSCASNERSFSHKEHDVRSTAETRSKNRSIADMIGGGEVSFEEVIGTEEKKIEKCVHNHEQLPQQQVKVEGNNKGRMYLKCPACTFFRWEDAL